MPKVPPRGLSSTGGAHPVKASFWNEDSKPPKKVVTCLFNPNSLSINKTAKWDTDESAGKDVPLAMFGGGGASTLTIQDLLFDTYTLEPLPGKERKHPPSVQDYTDLVVKLARTDSSLKDAETKRARPPRVTFRWGSFKSFKGVVTSVDQRFTLFMPDGKPVRAMVSVTLQEAWEVKAGTNPTSRGDVQRMHRVLPGELIDSIAFQFYGDAGKWPLIADFNRIGDPLRLQPGQVLAIPEEP